jgi:hypothetical protein
VPYWQVRGRRPFERASKIAHSEIIKSPIVQEFVQGATLPAPPKAESIRAKVQQLPEAASLIRTVIAVDGGLNETFVREDFPSASIAFLTFGPLMLYLEDLSELDNQPFIGPEDMARLKNLQRYSLVVPTRAVRAPGAKTFRHGVRKSIHDFLEQHGELQAALQWLLFEEWLDEGDRTKWSIPRCPNPQCFREEISFRSGDPPEKPCPGCSGPIYVSDAFRLYEEVYEETGASGILGYLLTALEQIVLVHIIRWAWDQKPELLREILLIKDGPLAFFGQTAPLHRPMRDLMKFLADQGVDKPLINVAGVEKTGPVVEHAMLIEKELGSEELLVLDNEYIYKHVVPGDPVTQKYGHNTYYGAKVIFKGPASDTYVVTVPTGGYKKNPKFEDLYNGAEVLRTTSRLRCSMYDNALVPVALGNRLVSLADVPSAEILKRFARERVGSVRTT